MSYQTIDDMAAANKAIGHHWFDDRSNAYFATQYHTGVLGGRYFITSEQDPEMGMYHQPWDGQRRFTVRMCDDRGVIHTVGRFGQHDSLEDALSWVHANILNNTTEEDK